MALKARRSFKNRPTSSPVMCMASEAEPPLPQTRTTRRPAMAPASNSIAASILSDPMWEAVSSRTRADSFKYEEISMVDPTDARVLEWYSKNYGAKSREPRLTLE
jgi:hypothetical protein